MKTFTVGSTTVAVIEDGSFFMAPDFLTGPVEPGTGERDEHGRACLPVLSFFVTGSSTVLVDAGLGPDPEGALRSIATPLGIDQQRMGLAGNAGLGPALAGCGVGYDAIDVVCISHLHADHMGWLVDVDGSPVFGNAEVLLPRGDYEYFVVGQLPQVPRAACDALRAMVESGRAELFDGEMAVSREVTAVPAPGHTPGHTIFAVTGDGERAMIAGDAMYCPAQLNELDVGGRHDIDPALARRTREMIAREAAEHRTRTVGGHFAGGCTARLIDGCVVIG
jgi:glyoxylase-like metal-dependent hydrolase (beta-lactamase superfamily II)